MIKSKYISNYYTISVTISLGNYAVWVQELFHSNNLKKQLIKSSLVLLKTSSTFAPQNSNGFVYKRYLNY